MTKVTTKKKLAVLGNGFLAGIIVEAYNKGLLEEYELTGILGRTKEKTESTGRKGGARPMQHFRRTAGRQAGLCGRGSFC